MHVRSTNQLKESQQNFMGTEDHMFLNNFQECGCRGTPTFGHRCLAYSGLTEASNTEAEESSPTLLGRPSSSLKKSITILATVASSEIASLCNT